MSGLISAWQHPLQSEPGSVGHFQLTDRDNAIGGSSGDASRIRAPRDSGLHSATIDLAQAIVTHQRAGRAAPVRLTLDLARLAVVEEQLAIAADTNKRLSVRAVRHVTDEATVGGDHFVILEGHRRVEDDRVVV